MRMRIREQGVELFRGSYSAYTATIPPLCGFSCVVLIHRPQPKRNCLHQNFSWKYGSPTFSYTAVILKWISLGLFPFFLAFLSNSALCHVWIMLKLKDECCSTCMYICTIVWHTVSGLIHLKRIYLSIY